MANGPVQLTLDGNEEPLGKKVRGLSETQEHVLKEIEAHPSGLRPVEIGLILHGLKGSCPQAGQKWNGWHGTKALGCCPYASTDGASFALRLHTRGLIARAGKRWFRVY
jgi:hypothetical protein